MSTLEYILVVFTQACPRVLEISRRPVSLESMFDATECLRLWLPCFLPLMLMPEFMKAVEIIDDIVADDVISEPSPFRKTF